MVHAIRIHEHGGPEVLRWDEIEVGEPGPGQVRIRQTAVGLNYIDTYHRSGAYKLPDLPAVIGMAGTGVVEALGPDVTTLKVGDHVGYAMSIGAYAESRLIAADRLVPLPSWLDEQATAATLLQGLTAQYLLRSTYVVLGCNAYLGDLEPRIAGKIMPIANYIIGTESLSEAEATALIANDACVCDTKFVVSYYRLSADRRLLFGGGETYTPTPPRDIAAFVRPYMLRVYPQLAGKRIDYGWGGMLAITMSRLPHIGRFGNLFYAHGYSGQGVATTGIAGKLIAEAVAGTAERFDVFASIRHQTFPGGTLLRHPLLVLAMLWYAMRDRL